MKKILFIVLFFGSYFPSFSQLQECDPDLALGLYRDNRDQSVYTQILKIFNANEKVQYLSALPVFVPLRKRQIALQDQEGRGGYILEGNIVPVFDIAKGRPQSTPFFQTGRVVASFGFNLRMAMDTSSPLLPQNNFAGFGLEKGLMAWYSRNGTRRTENLLRGKEINNGCWSCQSKSNEINDLAYARGPLSVLYFTSYVQHYSNGQSGKFFKNDSLKRNNYESGDFSTNFINVSLVYSRLSDSNCLFSASLGYQRDGNVIGPLSYTAEQEKSYGQNRLFGFVSYYYVNRKRPGKGNLKWDAYGDCSSKGYQPLDIQKVRILHFRYEYEVILGNLDNYPASFGTRKYRFSSHFFVEYRKINWRHAAFVLHLYAGRDYMNIRYDDIVMSAQLGLSFSFSRWMPPFREDQLIFNQP